MALQVILNPFEYIQIIFYKKLIPSINKDY